MPKKSSPILLIALTLAGFACTTVGQHDRNVLEAIDFGPREELRICILADRGVAENTVKLLAGHIQEELSMFGLDVSIPWIKKWERASFYREGIVRDVAIIPLEPPCDRLLALVGRNTGDFLFGLIGIETLGAVETVSHTKGFVVANRASINQLFLSPKDVAIHESYHLIGCPHAARLADCYQHIRELKRIARANRSQGNDFFPGVSWDNKPILTRHETDALVHAAFMGMKSASMPSSVKN